MNLSTKEIAIMVASLLETRIKLTLAADRDDKKINEVDDIMKRLEWECAFIIACRELDEKYEKG